MFKLVQNVVLGALAGAAAHLVITTVKERVDKGEPALPSALSAGLAGLIPLAKAVATQVLTVINNLEHLADGGGDTDENPDAAHTGGGAEADTGLSHPPQ